MLIIIIPPLVTNFRGAISLVSGTHLSLMIVEYPLGDDNLLCVLHLQLIPRMLPCPLCVLVSRLCRAGNKNSLKVILPVLFSEGPCPSVYAERGGVGAFDTRLPPDLETERQGWVHL